VSRRALLTGPALGAGLLWFQRLTAGQGAKSPARPLELPFRHIHLDFHTSPAVPDVGADFSSAEFVATLKEAAVNSITVFAKCHHGMAYYPTKVGKQHPGLRIDLLGEIIEACHKASIRVPVYISTMYDQHAWVHHGDWRVLDPEGKEDGYRGKAGPMEPSLGRLCVNTGYLEYLAAQSEEFLRAYPADGVFYDNFGYSSFGCSCQACMEERARLGLDSARTEDRRRHAFQVEERVMERLVKLARGVRPKGSTFVNGPLTLRQDPAFLRRVLHNYTHVEIESLPGGFWGYSYYPMAARYLRNFGLDATGMTGSFHRSWGDFGTVRNQAALDYECFTMLAQANKCAIGDHLHPRGRLNRAVYRTIGRTYRAVQEREPWCRGASAVTEIGLLAGYGGGHQSDSDIGASAMLAQLRHQFDLLDPGADFARYKILILADSHRLDEVMERKLQAYLAGGGKLLLSDQSGLDPEGARFVLPVGAVYEGRWKHEAQYLEVLEELRGGLPDMIEKAYETGSAVKASPGTKVLARVWQAYFDRDYRHFQVAQTPYSAATDYAAVTASGSILYIATPIFRTYALSGYAFYRKLVGNCLERFLPDPLLRVEGPSTLEATLTDQAGRRIVHLLHYIPQRRAPEVDIVEDVIPLHNVNLAARLEQRPRQVYLAPQRRDLPFEWAGGYARTVVPTLEGYQMIVFEF
jgi:hypothetical protein